MHSSTEQGSLHQLNTPSIIIALIEKTAERSALKYKLRAQYNASIHRFYYCATACNATHGIAVTILSVRVSVCQMHVL